MKRSLLLKLCVIPLSAILSSGLNVPESTQRPFETFSDESLSIQTESKESKDYQSPYSSYASDEFININNTNPNEEDTEEQEDTHNTATSVDYSAIINSQLSEMSDEIDRYKNGEKNTLLLEGATEEEKNAFDNILYIKAYGYNLSGYYISEICNSPETPYRITLKKDNNTKNNIVINGNGNDDYCYVKSVDNFIIIGYQWNQQKDNFSYDYDNSHIKILDSVHSTDSLIRYLNSKLQVIQSNNEHLLSCIQDINDTMYDYTIIGTGTVTAKLDNAYLSNSPVRVSSIKNNLFKCTVYKVTSGSTYRFKADDYSLCDKFPSVVFTTTSVSQPNIKLSDTVVLYSADNNSRDVDFIYDCKQDGYIVIAWAKHKIELKMYETEKINRIERLEKKYDTKENGLNELNNKTIAILGDSIMMLMRTNYSGTNAVSYLGSDGNTYTFDQLTNINGKLYVTADNSISCTVVNSNQNKLDNQNWDALKAKTGAADIINCGLGGATVKERQIITEYPYPDGDGKTGSLSNEVKMLKRLVQNGRSAPDCIVIWLGTNDSTGTLNTGNYDEIMALDYNTLADDTLGRSYRQTFYGGLRYSLETLCREYPFATIFVFTPIQTNPSNTRTYENLSSTGEALMKMANRYSCICVNALTEIGIVDLLEASDGSGNFLADGLHPNADGKKVFASFTAKKLNTLYFSKR